jgi:hypothetical protein
MDLVLRTFLAPICLEVLIHIIFSRHMCLTISLNSKAEELYMMEVHKLRFTSHYSLSEETCCKTLQ